MGIPEIYLTFYSLLRVPKEDIRLPWQTYGLLQRKSCMEHQNEIKASRWTKVDKNADIQMELWSKEKR